MHFFHKKKIYTMDTEQANLTLQKIFEACDKPSNEIPLSKLLEPRPISKIYTVGKWITVFALILTLLAPFAFRRAYVSITHSSGQSTEFFINNHYVRNYNIYLEIVGQTVSSEHADSYLTYYDEDGVLHTYYCTYYDHDKNIIAFPYYSNDANISITSVNGRHIQIVLSPTQDD